MENFAGEISFMATAAGQAFVTLMEPHRLMFLALGCVMGLVLGIIPGIGGLTGTAMLLPFTFDMDPYSAFAMLLGLGATTATGDPDSGDPVRRARRCRLRRDRARRLPDGEEGRGRPRAQRGLYVVADGRRVRRLPAGDQHPDAAPDHALYRLARAAGLFGARHIDGGGVVRQRAAARPRGRLPRRHDRDDRHRSADRHAALDLRQPLSVGRPAADAAAARHLRAAGIVRPR